MALNKKNNSCKPNAYKCLFEIEGENTLYYLYYCDRAILRTFQQPSGYKFYIILSFIWIIIFNGRHLGPFQQTHKSFAIIFMCVKLQEEKLFTIHDVFLKLYENWNHSMA